MGVRDSGPFASAAAILFLQAALTTMMIIIDVANPPLRWEAAVVGGAFALTLVIAALSVCFVSTLVLSFYIIVNILWLLANVLFLLFAYGKLGGVTDTVQYSLNSAVLFQNKFPITGDNPVLIYQTILLSLHIAFSAIGCILHGALIKRSKDKEFPSGIFY